MKNLKKIILICILFLTFGSCSKNEITANPLVETDSKEMINSTEKTKAQIVLIKCAIGRFVSCASGWGLCNCEILPDAPWSTGINTDLDALNNTMTLESQSFVNNGYDTLFVFADRVLHAQTAQAYGYSKITILKGDYVKNTNQSVTVDVQLVP